MATELYPVEPGFEMPTGRRKINESSIYFPFGKMARLKDSFPVSLEPTRMIKQSGEITSFADRISARIRGQATTYRKHFKPGFKVRIFKRNFNEHNECGLRVWRVK